MAITLDRTGITLSNDTGTPASPVGDGTLLSAADRTALLDKIDQLFNGTRSATFTLGTLLQVDGFGSHLFSSGGTGSNTVQIRNTTAGTGNYAGLLVGNNASTSLGALFGFSSTYTTAGAYFASGVTLESTGSGGLQLFASNASGPIRMYTGGTQRLAIDSSGVLTPLNSLKICAGFLARNTATDASVTNNSTIDFDTEVYDEQNNFSADTFTAPVTGRYLLTTTVTLTNSSGATDSPFIGFDTGNAVYYGQSAHSLANGATAKLSLSVIADMDASDTAVVKYYGAGASIVGSNAGTPVILETYFSGRLLL